MSSADFDEVMAQSLAALDEIAKGSPDGYKALYSGGDDITLGNPFGASGEAGGGLRRAGAGGFALSRR
jgi:hypothetical protein